MWNQQHDPYDHLYRPRAVEREQAQFMGGAKAGAELCGLGCGVRVAPGDVLDHCASVCPMRPTRCPLLDEGDAKGARCEAMVPHALLATHMAECGFYRVSCSGCGALLPRRQITAHMESHTFDPAQRWTQLESPLRDEQLRNAERSERDLLQRAGLALEPAARRSSHLGVCPRCGEREVQGANGARHACGEDAPQRRQLPSIGEMASRPLLHALASSRGYACSAIEAGADLQFEAPDQARRWPESTRVEVVALLALRHGRVRDALTPFLVDDVIGLVHRYADTFVRISMVRGGCLPAAGGDLTAFFPPRAEEAMLPPPPPPPSKPARLHAEGQFLPNPYPPQMPRVVEAAPDEFYDAEEDERVDEEPAPNSSDPRPQALLEQQHAPPPPAPPVLAPPPPPSFPPPPQSHSPQLHE
jgi:hypothetical protein